MKSIFPAKPKSKLTSATLKVNEEEISNKESIANRFCQFFSSIATTLLQSPHLIKDFEWNKQKNLPIRTTQKNSFCSITPSKICKCLKKLRRKKAHGIDKLSRNLDVANKTSKPMAFIIHKSLSSGTVSYLWKFQLHHFINQIQKQPLAITVQYLFYHVVLKY